MKRLMKRLLVQTGLRHIWNRCIAGNRIRIRGKNNKAQTGKSFLTNTTIQISGDDNSLTIGDDCRLHDLKIRMTGHHLNIEISNSCQLRGKIKVEDSHSQIVIGAGTTMENTYLGAYEGTHIQIGKDCMFSDQVGLRTGDMHSIIDSETQVRLNPAQSITVEPRVWLCRGVTVLKGCTIGTNTVVGAYSIVINPLPSGALAVGAPAKVIQENIAWRRERLAAN